MRKCCRIGRRISYENGPSTRKTRGDKRLIQGWGKRKKKLKAAEGGDSSMRHELDYLKDQGYGIDLAGKRRGKKKKKKKKKNNKKQ